MTFIPSKEFLIEVNKGNVPNHSIVHVTGRAPTSTGWRVVHDQVITGAAVIPQHLTAATLIRVKAGNVVNDVAPAAGIQLVQVDGLSSTWALQTEFIPTGGTSAGADSSNTFIRVFRARNALVGTYGGTGNGNVVVQNAAGTLDLLTMTTLIGSSLSTMYTIPGGFEGYLLEMNAKVGTAGDTRLVCYTRPDADDFSAPYRGKRIEMYQETVDGSLVWRPIGGLKLEGKTDVWFESFGGTSTIYVSYTILLIDL